MNHRITEHQGKLVICFEGDLDLEHSPAARRVLLDSVARDLDLLVDLSGVRYLDSSGVASLIEAFQASRTRGKRFALVAVGQRPLRVLQVTRLDRVFPIHANLEEALAGEP